MTTLLSRYRELLSDANGDNASSYRSSLLKKRMKNSWQDAVCISVPGQIDFVCLTAITISEALGKVAKLKKMLQEDNEDIEVKQKSDEQVIHEAIGILRSRIDSIKEIKNEYFSWAEIDLANQKKFVDPLLLKAIAWLTSKCLYTTTGDADSLENLLPSLAIASDIIYANHAAVTPKHLGLTNYIHRNFGSRKLIDVLHKHGYCISYDEYWKFVTSAAIFNITLQPDSTDPSKPYVPPEIHEGDNVIVSAADNWDHLESTVDGFSTTHAMTSILIQNHQHQIEPLPCRISKSDTRALDFEAGMFKLCSCYVGLNCY